MAVINDQHTHVLSEIVVGGTDEQVDTSHQKTGRPWVAPAWERRDTPMEVTMYAGQR